MARGGLQQKHIEVFRAVMRTGSVTGASRLLEMTQPSVSKIVGQAEELCAFSLFDRVHGRLVPTQRAIRLFDESESMFVGIEEISRLVDRIGAGDPKRVLIAAVPAVTRELLPGVVNRWFERSRDTFAISSRDGGTVLALVTSGRAELGLLSAFNRVPGVKGVTIAKSKVVCAIPASHPFSEKSVLTVRELHDQPYIALSRHEGLQTAIDRALQAANVRPREIVDCPYMSGALAMAAAGVGITLADIMVARSFVGKGLVFRPFEPSITFEYRAIWSAGRKSSFDRGTFLRLLREEAGAIMTTTLVDS